MYYINFFKKIIIFNYFYGFGSGYLWIIEYRDGYPKITNLDPDTLNFSDIRIRFRLICEYISKKISQIGLIYII